MFVFDSVIRRDTPSSSFLVLFGRWFKWVCEKAVLLIGLNQSFERTFYASVFPMANKLISQLHLLQCAKRSLQSFV